MKDEKLQQLLDEIAERDTDKLICVAKKVSPISFTVCRKINHLISSPKTSCELSFKTREPFHDVHISAVYPSRTPGYIDIVGREIGYSMYMEIGTACSFDLSFIKTNPVRTEAIVCINGLIDWRLSNTKMYYKSPDYKYLLKVESIKHASTRDNIIIIANDVILGTVEVEVQAFLLRLDLRFA